MTFIKFPNTINRYLGTTAATEEQKERCWTIIQCTKCVRHVRRTELVDYKDLSTITYLL